VTAARWLAGLTTAAVLAGCSPAPPDQTALPLRQVAEMALTGGPVRFDYTALDVAHGRLFIATWAQVK
jgi:hypothetical protein